MFLGLSSVTTAFGTWLCFSMQWVPVWNRYPFRKSDPYILGLQQSNFNALVIGFPEGGGDPGLMWGNTGTLWGLCNKFLPLWWGKCGDLDFWMPYSRGECGDFASVQLRGDWERSIVRSIDGKMAEEKKTVCFKIHCFFFLSNRPSVKNLYVFVGISNFKIPLCIYYCV